MKSDVYFIKLKTTDPKERIGAFRKLIKKAAPFSKYIRDEIIPVKITIGDSQCVYNLKPDIVKALISELKKKKTRPFLFDTNVIYEGERLNAVDHLNLVNNKGFGHSEVGAPFIIADGLFGMDGKEHQIKSEYISRVKAPSFVGMLDSLVVLSHVTGHILAGYAGAIKNVAMGISCRSSKQVQHSSLRPSVINDRCTGCGCCVKICSVDAISFKGNRAFINQDICIGCGECLCACKFDAILVNWKEDISVFLRRMAEVAGLVLSKFKSSFFINFAFDVTKECDCISAKDEKIISKDLGIFASTDILSVDKACADMLNKDGNIFLKEQGNAVYSEIFNFAHKNGLGNIEYNLKVI